MDSTSAQLCRSKEVDMESVLYNLTGIDLELYFSINTAGYTFLFLLLALPLLVLSVLCLLALFFADDINWKMRVLLINIFAVDITERLG